MTAALVWAGAGEGGSTEALVVATGVLVLAWVVDGDVAGAFVFGATTTGSVVRALVFAGATAGAAAGAFVFAGTAFGCSGTVFFTSAAGCLAGVIGGASTLDVRDVAAALLLDVNTLLTFTTFPFSKSTSLPSA